MSRRPAQIISGHIVSSNCISVGYGQIAYIDGSIISISHGSTVLPEAKSIEIVARDAAGEILKSFQLPVDKSINLHVTAPEINSIKASGTQITIEDSTHIKSIKVTSGNISVKQCQDITSLSTTSGNINIEKCNSVGKSKATSGNVNIRRDASPKRR